MKGLQVGIKNGELSILKEGQEKKFLRKVDQITFSADLANKASKTVYK